MPAAIWATEFPCESDVITSKQYRLSELPKSSWTIGRPGYASELTNTSKSHSRPHVLFTAVACVACESGWVSTQQRMREPTGVFLLSAIAGMGFAARALATGTTNSENDTFHFCEHELAHVAVVTVSVAASKERHSLVFRLTSGAYALRKSGRTAQRWLSDFALHNAIATASPDAPLSPSMQ